jgi:tRNA pseudouridine synthase B
MFNGILNVRKEKGFTSHDVVAKLRGILRQKKIGHTGTLDPAAEGVLPVCLGSATKLVEFLTDRSKTYRAVLLLGVETDSQDMTGTVLTTREVRCSEDEVRAAAQSFVGGYDQIPPMYSAKKQGGKKLVDLARQGITVERPARRVDISDICFEEISLPRAVMRVDCGKGTYIRTLCHDIGETLGCGGAMEALLRTRVGNFRLEDAYTLSELEAAMQAGEIENRIVSIEDCLGLYPARKALPEADAKLRNGNAVGESVVSGETDDDGALVRLYLSDGSFVGLFQKRGGQYRAEKMFLERGAD